LFILTTLINFEKSVSVYGSNDKKRWHLLADKQPIFDYSQYVDIRNTTVSFEKKKFNYYKVTVENVWEDKWSPFSQIITESEEGKIKKKYNSFKQQQEPFRLEKISFSGYSQNIRYGKRQTSMYQLAILYSVEDTVKKITEVYLSSKREPLRKLTLKIKGSNFKRYSIVEGTNDTTDDPQWRQIASSEIYSISAGEFSREEVGISFGEPCRHIKYRLKIINKDNTPIEVEAVTAEGDIHEVLLFHRNRRNLKVHYSSNEAKAPVYDVASVLEKTPVVNGNLWKVGSQIELGNKPKNEPFIKSKHILIIALVLMVVVLSGVLFMTVGKVEEKTRSENSEEQ